MQTTATVRTSLVLLTLLAATFSPHRSFAQTTAPTPEELLKQSEADVAKANADVKAAMDKLDQTVAELKAQNADLAAKLAAISAAATRPASASTTQHSPPNAEELQRLNADIANGNKAAAEAIKKLQAQLADTTQPTSK